MESLNEELDSLRSILRSDEHLQIQTSGDYEQIRLTLDHDIQVSFFFDALNVSAPFTIGNIHDLRVSKASSKCPLNAEQWTNIRKHFDELLRTSKNETTIRSLVQLVQDRLLQISVKTSHSKAKERKNEANATTDDSSSATNRFRGADLIFNRLLHDKTIDRNQVLIGYEDRFTGVHEIAFNEFKKVHDHEFGIPMHRIRHYKINGRLVWDRTKKFDGLTGSEQDGNIVNDVNPAQSFVQGMYRFDSQAQQWIVCPEIPLATDDPKSPSLAENCLPERCQFLTWNILFDYFHPEKIHTAQRYPAILQTLKSLLPDVICLQEVTSNFLNLLLNEYWVKENNYSIIVMKSILNSPKDQTFGQLMLTKNFQPRSFTICPLESVQPTKATKELIIARFGLNAKVTIDLFNVHLHSNRSRNASEKRRQALESLFKQYQTHNYMIIGDLNFGDYDEKEQQLLQEHQNEVHDLWKKMYSIEQDPGYTFNPEENICAQITSDTQIKRRFDRYLIHTLQNLSYSIEHLTVIGTDSISIDDSDHRVHLSDHYALQLILQFRTRSISHRSALVILPSMNTWPLIEPFREQYDPSYTRWPPHINVLWPFYDLTDSEDEDESVLLPLRLALAQYRSFDVKIDQIGTFTENHIAFMKSDAASNTTMQQLYEQLKQLFPQCCTSHRNQYNPHLTIGQFKDENHPTLKLEKSFQFPVQYLYVLQRSKEYDTEPFYITYQIPLGSTLEPISSRGSPWIETRLNEFFQNVDLYQNEENYPRKQEKFEQISKSLQSVFNKKTLHCFTHQFQSYGSFRLGIHGSDLDTVFVLSEDKSNNDETDFDRTLRQLSKDPSALTENLSKLIEGQIQNDFNDEIVHYRKIGALFPIHSILFNDETRVEIFIQIHSTTDLNQSIHGVSDIERLLVYVRCPPVFQHLLSFIRQWAEHVGLYGQVYGYLGGYSWAILCANICHQVFSSIQSLSSIEPFTFEQFFSLVRLFFSTYGQLNWSSQSLHLHPETRRRKITDNPSAVQNRGAMRILCPTAPYHNSARGTINSTRDLIHQGFQRVVQLLDSINTMTIEEKSYALREILQMKPEFPHQKIQSILELTIAAENPTQLTEWIGWIRSRLTHFFTDCEHECQLFVQPQNNIEHRSDQSQAIYSIGFNCDETALLSRRNFSHYLKKFLSQCASFAHRQSTMTLSHQIHSVNEWKMQRMQPKPQRVRK